MPLIVDYGLNSPSRRLLLIALSLRDNNDNQSMHKMHIHKVIRYFEYLRNRKEIEYSHFHYGDVSIEINEDIENLYSLNLIDEEAEEEYLLTEEGYEAAQEILKDFPHSELKLFKYAKYMLNELTLNELMYYMYMIIPESRKNSRVYNRLEKNKEKIIYSLYEKNKISAHEASKWMHISEEQFLKGLRRG